MIIDDVPALLGAQGQDLSIPVWLYFGIDLNPCFENFVGVGARVKTQMERWVLETIVLGLGEGDGLSTAHIVDLDHLVIYQAD